MSNVRFCSTHAGDISDLSTSPESRANSKFDYLFTRRRAPKLSDNDIRALAATMREGMSPVIEKDRKGSRLFAGYTYLGQFIDHDLTLDQTPFTKQRLKGSIQNFRTPKFDLDCLYGDGPDKDAEAQLYASDGLHFQLAGTGFDFVRCRTGKAHMGDPRNDSNRIISQLHVAIEAFHNRVVDEIASRSLGPRLFSAAREIVTRHYQWIVLRDYLPTIAGQPLVDTILPPAIFEECWRGAIEDTWGNLKLFCPKDRRYMPLEFSAAAFRFGHSMVRSDYELNAGGEQTLLFDGGPQGDRGSRDLRGFRRLPPEMVIEWGRFFRFPETDGGRVQLARPIEPMITTPMFNLPIKIAIDGTADGRNLPYRNLLRGETVLGLPTGQEVLDEMRQRGIHFDDSKTLGRGIPVQIDPGEGVNVDNVDNTGMTLLELEKTVGQHTPLWYYILKEASHAAGGEQLGAVGGRIVAEVLIGLMLADSASILRSEPLWRPKKGEFGCPANGCYEMVDLLRYAQVNVKSRNVVATP